MANSTCAGWGAPVNSTMCARIAGGTICTTSPAPERVTHTAPTGCATNKPPLLVRAGAFLHGHGQIAARGGDLSAGRRVPVPLCSRWRIAPPSPLAPDHQTTGATAARRRGRAHTARQAERARPEAGRLTAFSRWPRTQPRRGPRPQLSRPSLGGRGHSCFLPP